jgi:hypothetical protein
MIPPAVVALAGDQGDGRAGGLNICSPPGTTGIRHNLNYGASRARASRRALSSAWAASTGPAGGPGVLVHRLRAGERSSPRGTRRRERSVGHHGGCERRRWVSTPPVTKPGSGVIAVMSALLVVGQGRARCGRCRTGQGRACCRRLLLGRSVEARARWVPARPTNRLEGSLAAPVNCWSQTGGERSKDSEPETPARRSSRTRERLGCGGLAAVRQRTAQQMRPMRYRQELSGHTPVSDRSTE